MSKCFINNNEFDIILVNEEDNIISVESKTNAFFDVFECTIADKTIVLEQIDVRDNIPVVVLELTLNDRKYVTEALLVTGEESFIKINESNLHLVVEDKTSKDQEEPVEEQVEAPVPTKDDWELSYIGNSLNDYASTKINETVEELKQFSSKKLTEDLEAFELRKTELLLMVEEQFNNTIDNLNEEVANKIDVFFKTSDINNKTTIEVETDRLKATIAERYNDFLKQIENTKKFNKEAITDLLVEKGKDIQNEINTFVGSVIEENKNLITEQIDEIKLENKRLDNKLNELKKIKSDITNIVSENNSLKQSNDSTKKNVKKILEKTNEAFNEINNKLDLVTEKENKRYNDLLATVNNIDSKEYETILNNKIEEAELKQIKEALQEDVTAALKGDITALKRYVEMSSGGGSDAVNYADGGLMRGDLTVTGTVKAGTVLATSLLSATNLNTTYELSGFEATGNITSTDTVFGNNLVAYNSLSAAGNLYPTTVATRGQVIVANDDGNLIFGHGEKLHLEIRNDEGSDISAGTPVYSKGEVGGSERILVGIANPSDPNKMPAIGIAETTLNTTDAKDGFAIINGVYNQNISGFTGLTVGDTIYVASGGSLTNVKPTGVDNLIQNIGTALKVGGSGTILQGMKVSSIDRTNDIPNLSAKAIFYGQGDHYTQTPLSAAITDATGVTLQDGGISATGDITSTSNLSAKNTVFGNKICGTELYDNGNRVCTSIPTSTLQNITDAGSTTTNSISTNNTITANCLVTNDLNIIDSSGTVTVNPETLTFDNNGKDAIISHKDKGTFGNTCNLIIAASDHNFNSTAGSLILSGGAGPSGGASGGHICLNAGDGAINVGCVYVNAKDTGMGNSFGTMYVNTQRLSANSNSIYLGKVLQAHMGQADLMCVCGNTTIKGTLSTNNTIKGTELHTTGSVGIGTSDPQSPLHVIQTGHSHLHGLKLSKSDDSNTWSIWQNASKTLFFQNAGTAAGGATTRMWLNTDGKLNVSGDLAVGGEIDFGERAANDVLIKGESNSNDLTLIRGASNDDTVGVSLKYIGSGSGDENTFQIATDDGGTFTIDQSGDVGINQNPTDDIDLTLGTLKSTSTADLACVKFAGNLVRSDGSNCTDNTLDGFGGCENRVVATSSNQNMVLGGKNNRICGSNFQAYCNTIVGGNNNQINGQYGSRGNIIGGGDNHLISGTVALNNFIGAGCGNTLCGNYSFIGAGYNNISTGSCTAILAGHTNNIASSCSTITGGNNNTAIGTASIIHGSSHCTVGNCSALVGGGYNYISTCGSFGGVFAGCNNKVCNVAGVVLGGCFNEARHKTVAIAGGFANFSLNGCQHFIGGGACNKVCCCNNFIGGGFCNRNYGCNSTIVGGNASFISSCSESVVVAGKGINVPSNIDSHLIANNIMAMCDVKVCDDLLLNAGSNVCVGSCTGVTNDNIASCSTIKVCRGIIVAVS